MQLSQKDCYKCLHRGYSLSTVSLSTVPSLVRFFPDFKQKNLWNENKNRKKNNLKLFSLKLFKTLQNLVKTFMNLLKNLQLMNFKLFHVLKSIPYYFKTTITRRIRVILCTLWAKKGDFEIPKVINPDFSTKTVPN